MTPETIYNQQAKPKIYDRFKITDMFKIVQNQTLTEYSKIKSIDELMEKNGLYSSIDYNFSVTVFLKSVPVKIKGGNIFHTLASLSNAFNQDNKCAKKDTIEGKYLKELLEIFKKLPPEKLIKIKSLVNQKTANKTNAKTPMDIAQGCKNQEMINFINEMNIPESSTPKVLPAVRTSTYIEPTYIKDKTDEEPTYIEDKTDEESISSDTLSGSERNSLHLEEDTSVSNTEKPHLEQISSVGEEFGRTPDLGTPYDSSSDPERLTEKSFDSNIAPSIDSKSFINISDISDIAESEIQAEPDNTEDKTNISPIRVQIVALRIFITDKSLSVSEKIESVKRCIESLRPVYASDGKNFYHYYAIGYIEHIGTGKLSRTKSMIFQKPTIVRKHESDFKIIYNFINTYIDDLELNTLIDKKMATVKDNSGMTPWDYVLLISNKSGTVPQSSKLFEASSTTKKTIANEKLIFGKPSSTQKSLFSRKAGKSKLVKKTRKNKKTKRANKVNKAKKHKTHKK